MTDIYTAHNHTDLAGMLPTLFGFMPEHSIVAISTTGPRRRFGFRLRVDLPQASQVNELARLIGQHMDRQGAEGLVMMGVGSEFERAVAEGVMRAVQCNAEPIANLWIDSDASTVVDINEPESLAHYEPNLEALAMMTHAGGSVVGSRAEVAAGFEHRPGPLADAVLELLTEWGDEPDVNEMHIAMMRLLGAGNAPRTELLAEQVAVLTIACLRIEQRDSLWNVITRANARDMAGALLTAAVNAPPELAHPLYALTGFAEWMGGDGARAMIACDKALELMPDYAMAKLIGQLLEIGVNPDKWTPRV